MNFDHIAILYSNLDAVVEFVSTSGCWSGGVETFESEGTREIYFGPNATSSKVLALQAIADGPYQRAMMKRGPGVHHVAFSTDNLSAAMESLKDWKVHPITEKTKARGTAWFSKSGESYLLEIFEGSPKEHAFKVESVSDFLAQHSPFEQGSCWKVKWGSFEIPLPKIDK